MSTLRSMVTTFSGSDQCPWLVRPGRQPAAERSVLRGVVTLAEQAPKLTDEQLRSGLTALGGLVR